ncbi:MAG: hemolysin family protein [Firmicutes bacterium]|nr:hemolysin family protein [Bacillota bacterium]
MILLSFCFSFSETSFSTITKARLKTMAEKSKKARRTLRIYENFDRFLSTVLIGDTITTLTASSLCTIIFINYWEENLAATVSTIVMTVVLLIFCAVTPKTIAKTNSEKKAVLMTPFIEFFTVMFYPINLFFKAWKKLLDFLFKAEKEDTMTEDELITIIEDAKDSGLIDEDEREVISNVIEFYGQKTSDILIPRMEMIAIEKHANAKDVTKLFMEHGYSRLPVYEGNIDNVIGTIHIRDFFRLTQTKNGKIESIITPIVLTSEETSISDLFKHLQKKQSHIAVVVDEYGGTKGLVTMENIIEELLGDIYDESDEMDEDEDITPLEDGRFRVLCDMCIYEMFDFFEVDLTDEEEDALPQTVNGWITQELKDLPKKGNKFTYKNLDVKVTKTDEKKAIECVIKKNPKIEIEED